MTASYEHYQPKFQELVRALAYSPVDDVGLLDAVEAEYEAVLTELHQLRCEVTTLRLDLRAAGLTPDHNHDIHERHHYLVNDDNCPACGALSERASKDLP